MTEAESKELIHIAHEEGMTVMAHCNGARTAEAAAKAEAEAAETAETETTEAPAEA